MQTSYIIRDKQTGAVIAEKYEAVTARQHLEELNARVKLAREME